MSKPKDVFEIWPIEDLVPHPRNAKKHSADQVKGLGKLLKEKGFTAPIVVQKSTKFIIAGHGRRLASLDAGLTHVPVIIKDISDAEADALRLADNRWVSTDYDMTVLQEEMAKLHDGDIDLSSLGFSSKDLAFMVEDPLEMDEGSLVDDISLAVEDQKIETDRITADIDGAKTPIGEALGFRKVTVAQSRKIKAFVAQIETETGLQGAAALVSWIDELAA